MSADVDNKTRVLLVDDDAMIVWAVGRRLSQEGFSVTVCGDGAEALPLLREQPYDVLITDIQMPRMNGLALIEWTKAHFPDTQIIAITAFGSASVQKVSMKKGASLYLEKPVDPETLVDVIYSHDQRDSFSGMVEGIELFDYVQLLLMTKQQTVLQITPSDGNRGLLFFDLGNVIHAEWGDLVGEEAFYQCLAFEGGQFTTLPWRSPAKRTIELPGDFLIIEAARMKDESRRADSEQSYPDPQFDLLGDLGMDDSNRGHS